MYSLKLSRWRSGSGPQGITSASLSSVTSSEACSKWLGKASSWGRWAGPRGLGHSSEAGLSGGRLVPAPAPLEPALLDALAALGDVALQGLLVGRGRDVPVADAGGQA